MKRLRLFLAILSAISALSTIMVTGCSNFNMTANGFNPSAPTPAALSSPITPTIPTTTETPPVFSPFSDPVMVAMTGTHTTYDVGPGKTHTDLDTIPWGALVAGDVVNIYWRATPYNWKIGLRGQGTADKPIVVNGVTDASGNRPCLDFKNAKTAPLCNAGNGNDVFMTHDDLKYPSEPLGGIIIKQGPADAWGPPDTPYEPCWIQIKNLELKGAANGNGFTDMDGTAAKYDGSGGVWINRGEHILLENLVVHDNGFGIFTMAKGNTFFEAVKWLTVRSCRVYGNGIVGDQYVHNFYVQCHMPIIEGNYIGQVRDGSLGSSYKSRSSGEIFRYNYVLASARAIDWVYSEEQGDPVAGTGDGIAMQSEYGTDYAYGNIIMNDENTPLGAAGGAIHYGGDNLGSQYPGAPVMADPGYRRHLYFWNNTVIVHAKQSQELYKLSFFDLSLVNTTVDAWNNIFTINSDGKTPPEVSWVGYAGKLNLRGNNLLFYTGTITDSPITTDPAPDPGKYSVNQLGTLITGDPLLRNYATFDFGLGAGSPAIGKGTASPAGIPAQIDSWYPLSGQLRGATNGIVTRVKQGGVLDLGAIGYTPGI